MAACERRLETEIVSLIRKLAQAFEHDTTGDEGDALGLERRETERD